MTVWAEGMAALPPEARGAARRAWSLLDEAQRLGPRPGVDSASLRAAQELVEAARRHGLALRFTLGPGHVSAPGGVVHTAQDPAASVYPVLFGQGLRALVVHPEAEIGPLSAFLEVARAGALFGQANRMLPAPGDALGPGAVAPGIYVERADRFVEEHRRRHRAFLTPFEQLVNDLVQAGGAGGAFAGRSGLLGGGLAGVDTASEAGGREWLAGPGEGGSEGLAAQGTPGPGPLPQRETELLAAAIDRAETALMGAGQDADEAAHRLRAGATQEADIRVQVTHLTEVLVRLAVRPERPISDAHLGAALAGGLGILLSHGDSDAFMAGLRGVFAVARALGGQAGPSAVAALETGVASPATAATVARNIERVGAEARRWLHQWFVQRGASVPAQAWLTAFAGVSSVEGLRFLRALLAARPEVDRAWWLAQARTGEPLAVAEALVAVGAKELSEAERLVFVGALAHPAPQTRIQAAGLLFNDAAEQVREALGRLLLDPVRAVRQAALAALVQRGHGGDARQVAAVLRSPRFAELPPEEQERLAEALARLGGEHYLRVFKELLRIEDASRLGRLFRRETLADEPARRAAVHGLAALGTADALALLEQVRRRGAPPLDAYAAQMIEACTAGLFTRRDLGRPTRPEVMALTLPGAIEIETPVDLESGWRLVVPEAFGLRPDLSLEDLLMGYLDDGTAPVALAGQTAAPSPAPGLAAEGARPAPAEAAPAAVRSAGPPAEVGTPTPAAAAPRPDPDGGRVTRPEVPAISGPALRLPTLESGAERGIAPDEEAALPSLDSAAEGRSLAEPPGALGEEGLDLGALAEELAALATAVGADEAPASWDDGSVSGALEPAFAPLGPPSPESEDEASMVGPGFAWPSPDLALGEALVGEALGDSALGDSALVSAAGSGAGAAGAGAAAAGRPEWLAEGTDQSLWAQTPATPEGEGADSAVAVAFDPTEVAPELASLLEALEAPGPPAAQAGGPARPWRSALVTTGQLPDDFEIEPEADEGSLDGEGHLTAGPPPLLAVAMRTLDSLPQLDTAAPLDLGGWPEGVLPPRPGGAPTPGAPIPGAPSPRALTPRPTPAPVTPSSVTPAAPAAPAPAPQPPPATPSPATPAPSAAAKGGLDALLGSLFGEDP